MTKPCCCETVCCCMCTEDCCCCTNCCCWAKYTGMEGCAKAAGAFTIGYSILLAAFYVAVIIMVGNQPGEDPNLKNASIILAVIHGLAIPFGFILLCGINKKNRLLPLIWFFAILVVTVLSISLNIWLWFLIAYSSAAEYIYIGMTITLSLVHFFLMTYFLWVVFMYRVDLVNEVQPPESPETPKTTKTPQTPQTLETPQTPQTPIRKTRKPPTPQGRRK